MIILDATNEKIQFFLGGAITTNALHAFSAWSDKTSTTSTPGSTFIASNNTTDVDVVGSPAASTQRVVISLGITNRDTVAATVTFQWTDGTNDRLLATVTLAVGDTLQYVKDSGWSVMDSAGKIKSTAGGGISDGDTLATGLTFPNSGLHLLDSNASHDLIIKPGSDLTADRNLTVTTGDADVTTDYTSGIYDSVIIPIHVDATGAVTMTMHPSTERFLANTSRNVWKFDLTYFSDVRMTARVTTSSASVNSPRIRTRYKTTSLSTTISDYSDIGSSEVACSVAATGLIDSGWIALVAGAKADVFITVGEIGGDSLLSPVVSNIYIHARRRSLTVS